MKQYLDLLYKIQTTGIPSPDRTGTGTLALFGDQLRFDMRAGFPILTTKRVWWKGVVAELLWFLHGGTNIKELLDQDVHIWDAWARSNGDVGPVYGAQWRAWPSGRQDFPGDSRPHPIDQIALLIDGIRKNPHSRRHIVSAWNVAQIDEMALPPCHVLFQLHSSIDPGYPDLSPNLSLHLYQRSADVFLGVPFNIASYALLLHMIAHVTGHRAKELIISFGDVHIYNNHFSQVREQLMRDPRPLPSLVINPRVKEIDEFSISDMMLEGYNPHEVIKAPISV